MFVVSRELHLGVTKDQGRVIFVVKYMRKTYVYGLLTWVKIKQHLSLESPFTYFIQIVIKLSIGKSFVLNV